MWLPCLYSSEERLPEFEELNRRTAVEIDIEEVEERRRSECSLEILALAEELLSLIPGSISHSVHLYTYYTYSSALSLNMLRLWPSLFAYSGHY